MIKITINQIVEATRGQLIQGDRSLEISNITTDSRDVPKECLFVPLKGENFDGHDYIVKAVQAGAKACLVGEDYYNKNKVEVDSAIIVVEDTLKALGEIAHAVKNLANVPVVAVTGSVGKTSTKDMMHCVLSQQYACHKTQGNFNNEIGLPLTIFGLERTHELLLTEMGMNNFGEIERLSRIANPKIGVITNIGVSHIANLGSRQNILKAKLEILKGMDDDGVLIIDADDPFLSGIKDIIKQKVVTVGTEEGADFRAENILGNEFETTYEVKIEGRPYKVKVPVPGRHNVINSLLAIAVGLELNVSPDQAVLGIANYESGNMRQQIESYGKTKIINDAYNASPTSMKAAMEVLKLLKHPGKKIAVLGEMLELGAYSEQFHEEIGRYAGENHIELVITIGNFAEATARGYKSVCGDCYGVFVAKNNEQALDYLYNAYEEGDAILFKGSRGARVEEVYKGFKDRLKG